MQEREYHQKLEMSIQWRLSRLSEKPQGDIGTFSAFPNQAYRFEEMLNQARYKLNSKGFIFVPIRQPHQVQYKLGRNYPQLSSFEEEEQEAQSLLFTRQRLSKKRVSKEMFYCLLVLTELQKNSAAFLLTHVPDPIYFKLGDYSEIIHQPLDLVTICGKLLRGEYSGPQKFQNDMVTLIQNNKIYFLLHGEIYSLLLKFEEEFWFLWSEMVPKYREAYAQRLRVARFQGAEKRKTSKKKKYDKTKRIQLVALVAQQSVRRKKIILDHIKKICPQFLKRINNDQTIDIQHIPVRFLREIEALCEIRIQFENQEEEVEPTYTAKQMADKIIADWDIYFGSDDDD